METEWHKCAREGCRNGVPPECVYCSEKCKRSVQNRRWYLRHRARRQAEMREYRREWRTQNKAIKKGGDAKSE